MSAKGACRIRLFGPGDAASAVSQSGSASVAAALNERGITTARGRVWSTVQVDRVLDRIVAAEAR
jgi:hypothetical protein